MLQQCLEDVSNLAQKPLGLRLADVDQRGCC